jgi:DNA-binding MarR family transcriptional regulator
MIETINTKRMSDRVRVPQNKARRTQSATGAPAAREPHGRESVASLLRDTHRLYAKALSEFIRDADITIMQWLILRALWAEDGITQRELSERVGLYDSATVSAIDAIEEAGLVKRSRNRDDRRKINIYLTKNGRALEGKLLPYAQRVSAAAEQGLKADELEQFRRTLHRLSQNLERYLARPQEKPGRS